MRQTPILLRGSAFLFLYKTVYRGTGRIGHSWLGQQEPGGPSFTSRVLSSDVRIEEAWPVDRIKHPGNEPTWEGAKRILLKVGNVATSPISPQSQRFSVIPWRTPRRNEGGVDDWVRDSQVFSM
jgi:hypothetical protein